MDRINGPQPPTKRRLLKYNLRTLMVMILLISISVAWLGRKMRTAERQRQDVNAIVGSGGLVWYDFQVDENKGYFFFNQPTPVRRWLKRILGNDFFFEVYDVDANNPDEEMMTHVANLRSLKRLWVTGDTATDKTTAQLRGSVNLESLGLDGTGISDDGLKHLKDLPKLQILSLADTCVTDDGLEHVRELTNLKVLYLNDTQVSDEGFIFIRQVLPNCEIIGP